MTYKDSRAVLIEYLKLKVEQADWHGVSDAANDLRVLEAAHYNEVVDRNNGSHIKAWYELTGEDLSLDPNTNIINIRTK